MKEYGLWEPYAVKAQTLKTAIEAACMLLKVDDIVSGLNNKTKDKDQPKTIPEDSVTSDDLQR